MQQNIYIMKKKKNIKVRKKDLYIQNGSIWLRCTCRYLSMYSRLYIYIYINSFSTICITTRL